MTRPAAAPRLGFTGRRRPPVRSGEASRSTAAFEAAYRESHQELYRYARSIVRDDHAAEDVLQSTMERALVALQDESRDFELRPWLFRIAHNEAISRLRRDKPTAELSSDVAATQAPVSEQLETKQTLDDLWVDLATLPERQRQALVLRELSGLGHDEIGQVLGTSGRAVKQTIFEARRALLDCSEGRAMVCDDVQQVLSDGDGRVRRSRRMQSHLRTCRDCKAFDLALNERPDQLRALVPVLPAVAAASLLAQLAPGATVGTLGHVGGASAGFTLSSIGSAVATKAVVVAVASVTLVGGAGVAAVELRDPPRGESAPAGGGAGAANSVARMAGNAAAAAAAPVAVNAAGSGQADAAQRRAAALVAAGLPAATEPGVGVGGDRAAPQGAAGKARAAENRAAAADRRAAAAQRRANAAKGKAGGSTNASNSNGKTKSSGGSSTAGSKPSSTGATNAPSPAPVAKAPAKRPAAPQPSAAAPPASAGGTGGRNTPESAPATPAPSAPAPSKKPETAGKSG